MFGHDGSREGDPHLHLHVQVGAKALVGGQWRALAGRQMVGALRDWQATVGAVVGCVVGIPLGIVIGRELWDLFARSIDVVPHPTMSVLTLTFVGVGALIFANLVAAIPGRIAALTPTALVLRAE